MQPPNLCISTLWFLLSIISSAAGVGTSVVTAGACIHGGGVTSTVSLEQRRYLIRLPKLPAPCGMDGVMVLPLVVLIHCYGCEAWMEINKYAAAADRLQFVLVAPEGIERSFNSPSCCGAARESNIDDVAFVESIVEDLFLAQSRPASGAHPLHGGHIHISRQAIFAAGFSNGGFFVSHLASMSHGVAWAGIAAAAGHEYTPRRTEALAVAMQHCVHDRHVSINGCCASNRCCCGIEAPNCVTTEAIFRRWVEVNRCSNGTRLVRPRTSGMTDARCWLGIGCEAETSLCLWGGQCTHPQWSHDFSGVADHVLESFGRTACRRHGGEAMPHEDSVSMVRVHEPNGVQGTASNLCRCGKGRSGPYCLRDRRIHGGIRAGARRRRARG